MIILKYPIDSNAILRKKKSIKETLLQSRNFVLKKIAILGGSTTSEIKNVLELFLLNSGIKPIFYESDYNKYYEDAIFGNEKLNCFNPDLIYIHTSIVNIQSFPKLNDSEEDVIKLINGEATKFRSVWQELLRFQCPIIQNNFDYPMQRNLGNLDRYDIHGKTYFIDQLNMLFSKDAREISSLYLNDINYLSAYIGLENWFDQSLWFQAKYALSMKAVPELAFNISKIINSIFGDVKKCLVVDLDNTCWGGVIGDVGMEGIEIGNETAISQSYVAFQQYVKELKERGVSLAVCSKNNIENAKKGFEHPDSVLKIDDFAIFKANWHTKSQNIIDIASEINIGVDSLVFIDDNPVERDIVSTQVVDVAVPNVGDDVCYFTNHNRYQAIFAELIRQFSINLNVFII